MKNVNFKQQVKQFKNENEIYEAFLKMDQDQKAKNNTDFKIKYNKDSA